MSSQETGAEGGHKMTGTRLFLDFCMDCHHNTSSKVGFLYKMVDKITLQALKLH